LSGRDLGRLREPVAVTEVTLAPGNRAELLVDTRKGASTLVAAPVDRGSMGRMMGRAVPGDGPGADEPVDLLALEVAGDRAADPGPVPAGPAPRDLREEPVETRRTLDFAMRAGRTGGRGGMTAGVRGPGRTMSFTIDGQRFDPARTDQQVRVGS